VKRTGVTLTDKRSLLAAPRIVSNLSVEGSLRTQEGTYENHRHNPTTL